jgi:hypothetical protein
MPKTRFDHSLCYRAGPSKICPYCTLCRRGCENPRRGEKTTCPRSCPGRQEAAPDFAFTHPVLIDEVVPEVATELAETIPAESVPEPEQPAPPLIRRQNPHRQARPSHAINEDDPRPVRADVSINDVLEFIYGDKKRSVSHIYRLRSTTPNFQRELARNTRVGIEIIETIMGTLADDDVLPELTKEICTRMQARVAPEENDLLPAASRIVNLLRAYASSANPSRETIELLLLFDAIQRTELSANCVFSGSSACPSNSCHCRYRASPCPHPGSASNRNEGEGSSIGAVDTDALSSTANLVDSQATVDQGVGMCCHSPDNMPFM